MTNIFDSKGTHEVSRVMPINGRDFVVTLRADSTITIREKGKRFTTVTSLYAIRNLGIISSARDVYDKAMKEYERKKSLGAKRLRKPRMPKYSEIFSNDFSEAIKRR